MAKDLIVMTQMMSSQMIRNHHMIQWTIMTMMAELVFGLQALQQTN